MNACNALTLFFAAALLVPGPAVMAEPALPQGLGETETGNGSEPALPAGLDSQTPATPSAQQQTTSPPPVIRARFWESRVGRRLSSVDNQRDTSILETRLQLIHDSSHHGVNLKLSTDLVYDAVEDSHRFDWQQGNGLLDVREAHISFRPSALLDVRAGRQILTWGTGDLLFLNDLFPKDWEAFFTGRDIEYLKAPADAVRTSWFLGAVNLDLVYVPRFNPDRGIDGRRLSYYNDGLARVTGRNAPVDASVPDRVFSDDEWSARLYRNFAGLEAALYFHDGYWKSPAAADPLTGQVRHPELTVYGASVRGMLAGGIAHAEVAWYHSSEDENGDDPWVNNSEIRLLLGYEQELMRNLTGGVQYYLEHMQDHDAYQRTSANPRRDENRHLLTFRLTLQSHQETVDWSLFTYYSPSDQDAYLRPSVNWRVSDHWSLEAGGNVFAGDDRGDTFFAQFEDNSNLYLSVRYYFD